MAASAAGNRSNAEWGFTSADASVITLAGTSAGLLQGDIGLSIPRDYAFLQLDQDRIEVDAVCVRKEMILSCGMGEVLQANLQYVVDNDAFSGGVMTVDDDMGATFALLCTTHPPNEVDAGGADTRIISMPTALGIGDGGYALPLHGAQNISATFKAIGTAAGLLGTITDAYT